MKHLEKEKVQRVHVYDQRIDAMFYDSCDVIQGYIHLIFLPIHKKLLQASKREANKQKRSTFRGWAKKFLDRVLLLDQKLPQSFSALNLKEPKPETISTISPWESWMRCAFAMVNHDNYTHRIDM